MKKGSTDGQAAKTGNCNFIEYLETRNSDDAETALKAYIKVSILNKIKGTYISIIVRKATKTQYFLANSEEYSDLFAHMKAYVEKLDSRDKTKW